MGDPGAHLNSITTYHPISSLDLETEYFRIGSFYAGLSRGVSSRNCIQEGIFACRQPPTIGYLQDNLGAIAVRYKVVINRLLSESF